MPRWTMVDMTGVKHGRLLGVSYSHRGASGHAHWTFACDCGATVTADASRVRAGTTTSCGCRHREISAARLLVHGHRAEKRHDATYRAWQAMKDGCTNGCSARFGALGGRGVAVCPAWAGDYGRFLADMGPRPDGAVLERLDPARGFAPGNCAWRDAGTRASRAARGWERRRAGCAVAPA